MSPTQRTPQPAAQPFDLTGKVAMTGTYDASKDDAKFKPVNLTMSADGNPDFIEFSFKTDLTKVRTGRAHTGILDHVMVDYYGSDVPVNQVANVSLIAGW